MPSQCVRNFYLIVEENTRYLNKIMIDLGIETLLGDTNDRF